MKRLAKWLDKRVSGGPAAVIVEPHFVFHRRYYPWQNWYSILAYVTLIDRRGTGYELYWKNFR